VISINVIIVVKMLSNPAKTGCKKQYADLRKADGTAITEVKI